ncbi:hypothetical protein WA556_002939, partial [Blastocystis sp. ATCC 50177/Nand II]
MYHARTKGAGVEHMYFYCYEGFEQRNYDQELQREVRGFKRLIEARNRVVHMRRWADTPCHLQTTASTRDATNAVFNNSGSVNAALPAGTNATLTANTNATLTAGAKAATGPHTIIIDSREFKAELPAALYRYGFRLLPYTLEICDYVLTPSIGVERKSFQDLVNSLNHGRLQKQMEQMTRLYAYPLLLIEMGKRHFGLFRRSGEITRTAVKLVILMRSYPTMRILWSFQDNSSCKMFELIKKGKQEPTLEKVMSAPEESYLNGNKSDVDMIDLLLSFPGMNIDNAYAIFRRINKLSDICAWSLEELKTVMR